MKWLSVATILLLAVPSAAAQPCDPLPNGIGIYFDEAGCDYCAMPALYTKVSGHVLATNVDPSPNGVWGFEFKLLVDPMPLLFVEYFAAPLPVYMFPLYQTYSFPAADPTVVRLLTFEFVWFGTPIRLGLGPYVPSSGDGTSPLITPYVTPLQWTPLHPSIQSVPWPGEAYGYTVAWVGECPVAAEDDSWGAVKTLYR